MQRISAFITTAIITAASLPLGASAAPHDRTATEHPVVREAVPVRAAAPVREVAPRPVVREAAPRAIEAPHYAPRPVVREVAPRPVVREAAPRAIEAPHYAPRPVVREAAPRAIEAPHYAPRPVVREVAPRPVVREAAPRAIEAPHYAPRYAPHERYAQPRAIEAPRSEIRQRRNSFVRYYSRSYVTAPTTQQRVVFRRYVPQRIFVAPPVQVVRTYSARPIYASSASIPVSYVYSGYVPVDGSYATIVPVSYSYASMPLPLPAGWTPAPTYVNGYGDNDDDDDMYSTAYNQYGYAPPAQYNSYYGDPYGYGQQPYSYGYGQQPYGYNTGGYPYGMQGAVPFGNAQLQGVVISSNGSGLLVLTPSLKPVFVNTSIAQQNGYVNGNISPGSFVDVFGYDTGNEFIATALG